MILWSGRWLKSRSVLDVKPLIMSLHKVLTNVTLSRHWLKLYCLVQVKLSSSYSIKAIAALSSSYHCATVILLSLFHRTIFFNQSSSLGHASYHHVIFYRRHCMHAVFTLLTLCHLCNNTRVA